MMVSVRETPNLTAAGGRGGVQSGSLCNGETSKLFGGGRMNADGVLQDLDGKTAPGEWENK